MLRTNSRLAHIYNMKARLKRKFDNGTIQADAYTRKLQELEKSERFWRGNDVRTNDESPGQPG